MQYPQERLNLRRLGAKQTMEMKMLHWILEAVACVAVLLRGRLWLPTLFRRRATYALCQLFFASRPSPWPCVGCLLFFDGLAKLVSILRWSRGVAIIFIYVFPGVEYAELPLPHSGTARRELTQCQKPFWIRRLSSTGLFRN